MKVMMPHGQKSQQSKLEEALVPKERHWSWKVAKEEATSTAASSSTILIPAAPRDVPTSGIPGLLPYYLQQNL
jgi:hypothetical protein